MRTRLALLLAFGIPASAISQAPADQICRDPIPRMGDGLAYYDALGSLYDRLDSAFVTHRRGGSSLDADQGARLESLRSRLDSTFQWIGQSKATRASEPILWEGLGQYEAFVRLEFRNGLPPALNERLCPIRAAYLQQVLAELAEHSRKMEVRYGEKSERLNILEMVLNQWTTSRAPTGKLRDPSHWEWIVRSQTLGYQYNRGTRELEPAFPVLELGFSYYLFGSGLVSRKLHHLGVAGAFQRDVKRSRNLAGLMLHIQEFDLGVLCASSCKQHVIVASKNFSLFANTWTDMRKAINR